MSSILMLSGMKMKKTLKFSSDRDASLPSLNSLSYPVFLLPVTPPPHSLCLPLLSFSYRRTSETLSNAGLKATAAFSNMGSAISRKLEDVR